MNWFIRLWNFLKRRFRRRNVPKMNMERDWDSVREMYQDEVPAIVRRRQQIEKISDTTTANEYKCSVPAELNDENFRCWATVVKETNGNNIAEKKNAA